MCVAMVPPPYCQMLYGVAAHHVLGPDEADAGQVRVRVELGAHGLERRDVLRRELVMAAVVELLEVSSFWMLTA